MENEQDDAKGPTQFNDDSELLGKIAYVYQKCSRVT